MGAASIAGLAAGVTQTLQSVDVMQNVIKDNIG